MKGLKKCTNCGISFKGRVGPCCTARCAYALLEYRYKPTQLIEATSTMEFKVGDIYDGKHEVVRVLHDEFLQIYELLIKLKGVELTERDEKILAKWDKRK